MPTFEDVIRRLLPPERAEIMLAEHRQRIREFRVKLRDCGVNRHKYQQRKGVIPRPAYNAARSWVKKQAQELLKEDIERLKKGDFISAIPTSFDMFGNQLEKWIDRGMIDQFLCDMYRQGYLEPHPFGGWMVARPKIKDTDGHIVSICELPEVSNG